MNGSILFASLIGFLITFIVTPRMFRFLRSLRLTGIDQQKKNKPLLPTSAGIPLIIGFLGGLFVYIGLDTFILKSATDITLLLASVCSILIVLLIGLFDDLNVGELKVTDKKEKDTRIGLSQRQKMLLPFAAAIPLMAICAGQSSITIPFIGLVDVGLLYPLVLVPLIIVFCSNAANMLAGLNGLEAGIGIINLFALGVYTLFFGRFEGALIALIMASALVGILIFNRYPARILPGDTLTYLVGSSFASAVIIGNVEKFAVILVIPWLCEFFLKLRKRFKVSSLGVLQKDGTLKSKYDSIYSLTHVPMKIFRIKEWQATLFLLGIQLVFVCLAFIVTSI